MAAFSFVMHLCRCLSDTKILHGVVGLVVLGNGIFKTLKSAQWSRQIDALDT